MPASASPLSGSATADSRPIPPFSARDKFAYGMGDLGNDLTFVLVGSFLMIFATNVAGVPARVAGYILLGARLVDAFFDVFMGRLVDILPEPRQGRYRVWIKRMSLPIALLAALCFFPMVGRWPGAMATAWIAIAYFCYGIVYSAMNIPYGSMATVITPDPGQRASLSVYRSLGAAVGGVAVMALSYVVYTKDPASGRQVLNASHTFWAAVGCGIAAMACHWYCYRHSFERVRTPTVAKQDRQPFSAVLASMLRNRALLAITVASLLLVIAIGGLQALQSYLWLDYFANPQLQMWGGLALLAPALLLAPFAARIGQRLGKREFAIIGMIIGSLTGLLGWVLKLHNPLAFLLLTMFAGLGAGVLNLLIWAMITDVIDYQELKFGERDNGTVYATYSWARKLGQALAGGMTGWLLSAIGYQSSRGGHVQQSERTRNGLYTLATLGPGVLFGLLALVLILWYPLGRREVDANAHVLAARRQAT